MSSPNIFESGNPAYSGLTTQEVDSLPTRVAQATGVCNGTNQQAIGQINSILIPVMATAGQASDIIQQLIEDSLSPAAQTAALTTGAAVQAISQLLAPAVSTATSSLPPQPVKRTRRGKSSSPPPPPSSPALSPAPAGCTWVLPPPGSLMAARLVCSPSSLSPPPVASPPAATPPVPVPVGTPPSPPQPTGGIPQSPLPNPQVAGSGPGGATAYWLYYNCALSELIAVPAATPAMTVQLAQLGYQPATPPTWVWSMSAQNMAVEITYFLNSVLNQCATSQSVQTVGYQVSS